MQPEVRSLVIWYTTHLAVRAAQSLQFPIDIRIDTRISDLRQGCCTGRSLIRAGVESCAHSYHQYRTDNQIAHRSGGPLFHDFIDSLIELGSGV